MIFTIQSSNYVMVYDIEYTICFVAVPEISLDKNFSNYLTLVILSHYIEYNNIEYKWPHGKYGGKYDIEYTEENIDADIDKP